MNKKLIATILIIAAVTVGFIPKSYIYIRYGKQALGVIGFISLFSLLFVKNIWLRLFIVWVAVRTGITIWICGRFDHSSLLYFITYILFYVICIEKIKKEWIYTIFNAIGVLVLIECAVIVLQNYGIWIGMVSDSGIIIKNKLFFDYIIIADSMTSTISNGFKDSFVGTMSNTNVTSAFLALGLPVFFRKNWCYCIPIVLGCLFLTVSLGGILPALIATVLYCFLKFKKARYYIIVMIILIFGVYVYRCENSYTFLTGSGRLGMWWKILKLGVLKHPVIGYGIGSFSKIWPQYQLSVAPGWGSIIMQAHSEYIQCLFEFGMIGLFLAIGFIVSIFKRIKLTEMRTICLFGVVIGLINCGASFLFHTSICCLMLFYLAIIEKENELWESQKKTLL